MITAKRNGLKTYLLRMAPLTLRRTLDCAILNCRLGLHLLAMFLLLLVRVSPAADSDSLKSSKQLIVVTTSDWAAVSGSLQRFQRSTPRKKWRPVGGLVSVAVGKNGLGWGSGILPAESLGRHDAADPIKQEGDGKAPAGIFRLSRVFGYAQQAPSEWKMPYLALTPTIECVDDSSSKFYNHVVDRSQVSAAWKSSEHMLRSDDLYRWGIVADHNADPPQPEKGSCIFLHIWRGPGQGTVGCTAMPEEQLKTILMWLDPREKPVLAQFPISEYRRLKQKLRLP